LIIVGVLYLSLIGLVGNYIFFRKDDNENNNDFNSQIQNRNLLEGSKLHIEKNLKPNEHVIEISKNKSPSSKEKDVSFIIPNENTASMKKITTIDISKPIKPTEESKNIPNTTNNNI